MILTDLIRNYKSLLFYEFRFDVIRSPELCVILYVSSLLNCVQYLAFVCTRLTRISGSAVVKRLS